jgi:serine/threonine-protein phosphatase 2A regulatory subunit B'
LFSIINGFALPLKDEHKLFLEKTLLPLHKTRYLSLYFRQLSYCIVQFIEKDPSLSIPVIRGLLRIWPKTNTTKEVMFLSEIEEILDIMPVEYFGPICEALFKQLALCIDSNHFQVAERALMFWHIEYITDTLIGSSKENLERILKIILPVLSKHSKSHWNRNVQLLILNALECFMSIDPVIFDACVAQLPQLQEEALQRRKRLYHCWNELDSIESRRRTVDSEFDKARQDLYKLLLIDDDASSGGGSDRENSRNTNNSSISASTSQTNTTKAASSSQIVNTRRKSVLPVDTNVYQELLNYSRSSSPRPSDEEIDSSSSSSTAEANDNNMKD